MATEIVEIKNRWTGGVIFSAEVGVTPDMWPRFKLGLAVRLAVEKHTNLTGADLAGAYLAGAYLAGADLTGADLAGADLTGADLAGASLAGAYLAGADLARANLAGASLAGAEDIKLPPFQIPQEGELIVWKKLSGGNLCKLRIPPEARRTASVVGRECRAEFAEVLEGSGMSWCAHDHTITYAPGETVRPDGYDDNPLVECAQGIHFFLTREEAEAW